MEGQPGHSVEVIARAEELRDANRLSLELDAVLARRADIERRQRPLGCKGGLDTRPISTVATRLRRELVTPELRNGIRDEINELDLGGVPFRFDEAGYPIQSPYVSIANRQAEIMMRIASEFGFTPASRSRISTPIKNEPNLFDLLGGSKTEPAPE